MYMLADVLFVTFDDRNSFSSLISFSRPYSSSVSAAVSTFRALSILLFGRSGTFTASVWFSSCSCWPKLNLFSNDDGLNVFALGHGFRCFGGVTSKCDSSPTVSSTFFSLFCGFFRWRWFLTVGVLTPITEFRADDRVTRVVDIISALHTTEMS